MSLKLSQFAGILATLAVSMVAQEAKATVQPDCPYLEHYKPSLSYGKIQQLVKTIDKKTLSVGDKTYNLKEEADRT